MAKPSKVSKFFKTLLVSLLVLIVAITVVINALFMKSSSAPFNNSIYIMQQFDMNDVQYGDAVISSASKVSELQPGNVVLCLTSFDNEYKEVLKLIDITQEDGTTYYYVKSDEESKEDALKLTQDKILAKCLWTNSTLGYAITFAKSTMGIGILTVVPCLILLIMKISSTVAKQKEVEKEEELRKNNKKRKSHTQELPIVKSNDVDSTEKKSSNKKFNNSKVDADEFFNKPVNKTIPVKTLSKEESIKQRENVSNIVGSELESATIEIKNGINKDDIKVSPASHIDMVKIDEEPIIEESVHSPNMIAKANKIRQSLSNNDINNFDSKSVESTPIVESKPVKNTPIVESKPVENTPVVESKPIEDISVTKIDTDKPVIFNDNTSVDTVDNNPINEDDFLSDIIGNSKEESNSSAKISDDILDQLLNSIPSKTAVESPKKSVVAVAEKPIVKKSISKIEHHITTKTITKRHKSSSKVKDNTSFDELLKAIEKEKNSLK